MKIVIRIIIAISIIGFLSWLPAIVVAIQGDWANPRPMLYALVYFPLALLLTFVTVIFSMRQWLINDDFMGFIYIVLVYVLSISTTIGPFFIFPAFGYSFGK